MQIEESVQTPQNVFNIYYRVKYVKESKGVRASLVYGGSSSGGLGGSPVSLGLVALVGVGDLLIPCPCLQLGGVLSLCSPLVPPWVGYLVLSGVSGSSCSVRLGLACLSLGGYGAVGMTPPHPSPTSTINHNH